MESWTELWPGAPEDAHCSLQATRPHSWIVTLTRICLHCSNAPESEHPRRLCGRITRLDPPVDRRGETLRYVCTACITSCNAAVSLLGRPPTSTVSIVLPLPFFRLSLPMNAKHDTSHNTSPNPPDLQERLQRGHKSATGNLLLAPIDCLLTSISNSVEVVSANPVNMRVHELHTGTMRGNMECACTGLPIEAIEKPSHLKSATQQKCVNH